MYELSDIDTYKDLVSKADFIINFIPFLKGLDEFIVEQARNAEFLHMGSRLQFDQMEIEIDEKSNTKPQNKYAKVKLEIEELYKKANGILIRASNVYGPSQNFFTKKTTDTYLLSPMLKGKELCVDIPKEAFKDMLYIDDLTNAIVSLFQNGDKCKGEVFVIGSSRKTTIAEMVDVLQDNFVDSKIRYEPIKDREKESFVFDCAKVERFANWRAKYSFREGFGRTITTLKKQKVSE
ncbi:MAG: NAD(P)-dependent oxidoreductase [Gammaproteobacteria bacterium]|nr:NAD(P)-dependent oxidoreductase [Gammaproteobacteria bacterium]